MSLTYPRYLTFLPGELEKKLREIDNTLDDAPGRATALALALTSSYGSGSGTTRSGGGRGGRSKLLKIHRCTASFPDGITGSCTYTRGGPTWHIFQFIYGGEGTGSVPAFLPPIYWTKTMGNDIPAIEAKAKELAETAYLKAALREQTEYFARASEGSGRRKHPEGYRMTAGRAKEMGGKYALCVRVGGDSSDAFVPICPAHEHLVKANADWLERRDPKTVVACCNRLDRRWQLPRFNPLYAEFDPRPEPEPVKPVYMVMNAANTVSPANAVGPVATPVNPNPSEPDEDEEEEDDDCGDDYDEDYDEDFDDEENFDDADDDADTDEEEESEAEETP